MPKQAVKVITTTDRSPLKVKILLLGSERIGQTAIREALEREGHLVLAADDLGAAVLMLAECPVDLLITHPYIAELPGHEAIKYLRTKRPGMPALMLAGVLHDDRIETEAAIEEFSIFPPPFTGTELFEAIRQVLNPILKSKIGTKIGRQKSDDAPTGASEGRPNK